MDPPVNLQPQPETQQRNIELYNKEYPSILCASKPHTTRHTSSMHTSPTHTTHGMFIPVQSPLVYVNSNPGQAPSEKRPRRRTVSRGCVRHYQRPDAQSPRQKINKLGTQKTENKPLKPPPVKPQHDHKRKSYSTVRIRDS